MESVPLAFVKNKTAMFQRSAVSFFNHLRRKLQVYGCEQHLYTVCATKKE